MCCGNYNFLGRMSGVGIRKEEIRRRLLFFWLVQNGGCRLHVATGINRK
uniref:Uncharacterized protein n=1 Tax=Rhizophora mucronata TaxID=61149 RepID=A0A2P2IZ57_RHIMU